MGVGLTAVTLMEPDRQYQVSNMVSAEEQERRGNHSVRGSAGVKCAEGG